MITLKNKKKTLLINAFATIKKKNNLQRRPQVQMISPLNSIKYSKKN